MQNKKVPTSATNNSNSGHRKRLREKFLYGGGRALYDYEKLELLLTYCIPRRDVKPLAKTLINHFGSIRELMNAPIEELTSIPGISENSGTLFILLKEFCTIYLEEKLLEKPLFENTSDVINFARMKIGGNPRETYMILCLNARNRLINYECFQEGDVDKTVLYCKTLAQLVLKHNAVSVIIIHNHPSGICIPSENDLKATVRITKALSAIDIILLDHIIVSSSDFHSMAANDELPKMQR